MGRFVSPDPFIGQPGDPQNHNRYSYVVNNPVNGIDPDGNFHKIKKKKKSFFRRFFGTIVGAIFTIITGGSGAPALFAGAFGGTTAGLINTANNGGNFAANVFGGAFLGGLGGALAGPIFGALGGNAAAGASLSNLLPAIGTGALVGSVTGAISTAIYGGDLGQNVGFGALGGAVTAAAIYGGYKLWGMLSDTGLPRAAASEIRPELEAIANDPPIRSEIDKAWAASNPSGPAAAKQERGFWILRDSKTQALAVQHFPPGGRDFMIPGPTPEGGAAFFHTHPNTVAEGYLQGPSPRDARFATSRGIPGIIRSHDGMYYFGPPLR